MRSLKTIQTISKICMICSKIGYVFCLVGGIICAVAVVCLALIPESFKLGGVTVSGLIQDTADIGVGTAYAAGAAGIVTCVCYAVLFRLAGRYFKNELDAGTPFTLKGAKELMSLGICTICIPVGAVTLCRIIYHVAARITQTSQDPELDVSVSVAVGVMLIVLSLVCRCGADFINGNTLEGEPALPGEQAQNVSGE